MRVVLGLVSMGLVLSSCLEPTQVYVTITTDLRCSPEESGMYDLDRTDVQVRVGDETRTVGSKVGCSKGRVGSIVFVPGDHPEVRLHVMGTVRGIPEPVTADRILRFLPHQSLELDVALTSACVGVKCDTNFTCEKGQCVPIPENVPAPDSGTPRDASDPLDAFVMNDGSIALDGGKDVNNPLDGAFDAAIDGPTNLDSGACKGSPLMKNDVHWGFDEGTQATTIKDDSMAYTANLVQGVTLVNNPPCGTALSYMSTSSTQNLSTNNWGPQTAFSIAFGFQWIKTSGPFMARNIGAIGGWQFAMGNMGLEFTVWDNGKQPVMVSCAILANQWVPVIGRVVQNTVILTAGNCNAQKAISVSITPYTASIFVGTPNMQFLIDELYLGL